MSEGVFRGRSHEGRSAPDGTGARDGVLQRALAWAKECSRGRWREQRSVPEGAGVGEGVLQRPLA